MDHPPIALFGRTDDAQIHALQACVAAEGGRPVIVPIRLDDKGAPVVSLSPGRCTWGGADFDSIAGLYIRAMAPNTLPALPPVLNAAAYSDWRGRYVREQEYQAFAYGFFETLAAQGKLVINRLSTYQHHNSKAQFYERLRAGGFPVPETLSTSDPQTARGFIGRMGRVVAKPSIGIGSTRIVLAKQKERLDELRRCPVTFQRFIRGQTIRVHIVADTVVLSLHVKGRGVDSRTGHREFSYVRLPEEQEKMLVRANRLLGLHFAAWDIIRDSAGQAYYLDCNPGPYLMWIGDENVRGVYRQLARYLVGFCVTRSVAQAAARVEPVRQTN